MTRTDWEVPCATCDGAGEYEHESVSGPEYNTMRTCPECDGAGVQPADMASPEDVLRGLEVQVPVRRDHHYDEHHGRLLLARMLIANDLSQVEVLELAAWVCRRARLTVRLEAQSPTEAA